MEGPPLPSDNDLPNDGLVILKETGKQNKKISL